MKKNKRRLNIIITSCGEDTTHSLVEELIFQMCDNMEDFEFTRSIKVVFDKDKDDTFQFSENLYVIVQEAVNDLIEISTNKFTESDYERIISKFSYSFENLNGDFSQFRNKAHSHVPIGDWVVQLDADEDVDGEFILNLNDILSKNDSVDLIYIARENIVNGITDEYIRKMGWTISEDGLLNYPDYQGRIYKKLTENMWINKVHEVVSGVKTKAYTKKKELTLVHVKDFEKQKQQNEFYDKL